jgi:F plasmid transfer operon protein TraF
MNRMLQSVASGAATLLVCPAVSHAQPIETIGTRAAGMGGAYVAVVDDASAVYWNPAGFAAGSYFSLVLDRGGAKVNPESSDRAGSRSGFLIALGAPALGLSYYRLRRTTLSPTDALDRTEVQLDTLTTHHSGATLVQSIGSGLAVGATLKLVRGVASSVVEHGTSRDALLDEGVDFVGKASNKIDADLGVMASLGGQVKAGLSIRNLTEPSFETPGDVNRLTLQRQARAGVALRPLPDWVVAADLDLLRSAGPLGDRRDVAVGGEGKVFRRGVLRGGFRVNTLSDDQGGHARALSVGASYAIRASFLVDAQVTGGSDRADHGWGISARLVY